MPHDGRFMQQEWRDEDEAELRAGLSAMMKRIASHCARKDTTVWPQSVSARLHLPASGPQAPALAMTAADAVLSVEHQGHEEVDKTGSGDDADMLTELGLSCWWGHSRCSVALDEACA